MPIPTFTGMGPNPSFDDVTRKINTLVNELRNLMLSLDTLNVVELDAEVIIANTITADKMNVTQLSAISANLGTITAGIIYGAYIATANGTYPRIEFSSVDNLLKAMSDANNHIRITPISGTTPAFIMQSPLGTTLFFQGDDAGVMNTSKKIQITGTLGVSILSPSGNVDLYDVKIDGGTQLNTLSQANSTATTVAEIVADFNSLLTKLRSTNILV